MIDENSGIDGEGVYLKDGIVHGAGGVVRIDDGCFGMLARRLKGGGSETVQRIEIETGDGVIQIESGGLLEVSIDD